jgi:CRISPR-associated protein Csb2
VLVQIPPGPLAEADVLWALSGRTLYDAQTGEVGETMLATVPPDEMVMRYRSSSRKWRSVTPLALASARRRRIEPAKQREEAKSASERGNEEHVARQAVRHALRHAGVTASLVAVHVQREPFEGRGTRAERFAHGTRFPKETLWHVEIECDRRVPGPLVLGDGRFLGLGVMVPSVEHGIFALDIEGGLSADVDTTALARALRRAVMARVQGLLGRRAELPSYFHGHATNGEPLKGERSMHVAFAVDLAGSRLLIVPPHILDRRRPSRDAARHLELLDRALEDFEVLRAGSAGLLSVRASSLAADDPLLRSSRRFQSVTDYVVSRHTKRTSAEEAVADDVRKECDRRNLPTPQVRVMSVRGVPSVGVLARVELTFAVLVPGPLLLGKTRHVGGGLFAPQ